MDDKEQDMTPPELMDSKNEELSINLNSDLQKAMLQVVNLSNNVLHEPTCVICSNPNRREMEAKWLESKKLEDVKNIIKGKSGIEVSDDVINNHMLFHIEAIREIQKVEYIGRIRRLNDSYPTTLSAIYLCLSALTEQLMSINSMVPDTNMSQNEVNKIKATETSRLMNAFSNILKLKAMIEGEMKNTGELIVIPRQMFINVFQESILESKSEVEKEAINKILNKLLNQNIK
jgi:hypothetical protein